MVFVCLFFNNAKATKRISHYATSTTSALSRNGNGQTFPRLTNDSHSSQFSMPIHRVPPLVETP